MAARVAIRCFGKSARESSPVPSPVSPFARVGFLPAAVVPRSLRRRLEPALGELLELLERLAPTKEVLSAHRSLRFVIDELRCHGLRPGETCVVTKEAVFAMSEELDSASRMLAKAGLHAASLVPTAVDDQLLALVAELQPVAPA
jgi:hypothetical protein